MIKQGRLYLIFKYSIYALLTINVGYFFIESLGSAEYTYIDGMKWSDIIVAYAAPIDTAAWLVLLLVLELETFIIEDEELSGPLWWAITTLNAVCFIVIAYSFYGYIAAVGIATGFAPYSGMDPCGHAGTEATFLISHDDYVPLTQENCASLADASFYNETLNMFGNMANMHELNTLVWLDVVNAGIWIIIVIILELEVYLKSSILFGTRFFTTYKWSKLLLYGILFINAIYWWILGEPWDAWDAMLWLLAFFFIEMNVLSWQEEVATERFENQKT